MKYTITDIESLCEIANTVWFLNHQHKNIFEEEIYIFNTIEDAFKFYERVYNNFLNSSYKHITEYLHKESHKLQDQYNLFINTF